MHNAKFWDHHIPHRHIKNVLMRRLWQVKSSYVKAGNFLETLHWSASQLKKNTITCKCSDRQMGWGMTVVFPKKPRPQGLSWISLKPAFCICISVYWWLINQGWRVREVHVLDEETWLTVLQQCYKVRASPSAAPVTSPPACCFLITKGLLQLLASNLHLGQEEREGDSSDALALHPKVEGLPEGPGRFLLFLVGQNCHATALSC